MQLTLNDIQASVQIIDLALSRGAFRGEEITVVAKTREALVATVTTAQAQAQAQTEEPAPTEEPEENTADE